MLARVRTYLLGTLPSAGVLGGFPPGQYVPNLLVLNNYSKPSSLAHAYVLGSRSYSKTALLEYMYAHTWLASFNSLMDKKKFSPPVSVDVVSGVSTEMELGAATSFRMDLSSCDGGV